MLGNTPEDTKVSRYELGLVRESIDQKIENSYLRGQLDFANKMTEQAGFNATIATQLGNLTNSFNSLTRTFVPNDNVAPGWGFANVQPAPPMPPYPYPYPFYPLPPIPEVKNNSGTTTTGG